MAALEVRVPDIGDFEKVEVIEVLVKPGDRIAAEQSLVTYHAEPGSPSAEALRLLGSWGADARAPGAASASSA